MSDNEDNDDVPTLSAETFAALQQFYKEEDERESIKLSTKDNPAICDMSSFNEDWNLSQFWYDDKTSEILAKECIRIAGTGGKIACISAPSAYTAIKKHFPNSQGKIINYPFLFEEIC